MDADLTIINILEQFFGLTGISACWTPNPMTPECLLHRGIEPAILGKYLDFGEVSSFISRQWEQDKPQPEPFHTLYTRSSLIYNIHFTYRDRTAAGAFIAGPVLLYSPLNYDIDYMLEANKLRQSDKQNLQKTVSNIAVLPESMLTYLASYMALLISSPPAGGKFPLRQIVHGEQHAHVQAAYHRIVHDPWLEQNEEAVEGFPCCNEVRTALLQGDVPALRDLLQERNCALIRRMTGFSSLQELKNECIKISALGCSWAVEGKADSSRCYLLLNKSVEEIDSMRTTPDMIRLLQTTLISYSNLVASSYNTSYSKHINNILHYINSHYTESITLDLLAGYAGLHPNYLSNLIKRETGHSLIEIINSTRIEKSKFLLLNSSMTILQVAQTAGFNYQNYFSSIFKKLVGMTPKEYRMHNGKPRENLACTP